MVHGVPKSWTRLSDFTFTFRFQALKKAMANHSSALAWRIPGTAAWWAAVYGFTQSWTWLKRLSSSSSSSIHVCINLHNTNFIKIYPVPQTLKQARQTQCRIQLYIHYNTEYSFLFCSLFNGYLFTVREHFSIYCLAIKEFIIGLEMFLYLRI